MNFQERMKLLARKNATGTKTEKWTNITFTLRQEDHALVARIAEATGEKLTTVVREFLETNRARLSKLATELERGVPEREKLPTMEQIKAFAKDKKGKKK